MLGITADGNDSYHSPGVDIVVSGLTGYDTVTVERIDDLSQYPDAPVRGIDGIPVVADTEAVTDYEAPIGRSVSYTVTAVGATTDVETSSSVTIPYDTVGDVWLKSVSQPALSRRVNVSDWNDITRPGRILGEYEVLGRANKVVITDVLGGREGSIAVATFPFGTSWESDSYHKDLLSLISSGGTLFIQTTGVTRTGEEDMYFEVKSLSRKRLSLVGGELVHLHEISYIEVDRPATILESLGLRSWQDVLDDFADWDEVLTYYTSWLDVLQRDGP